jgi:hypothetical protein
MYMVGINIKNHYYENYIEQLLHQYQHGFKVPNQPCKRNKDPLKRKRDRKILIVKRIIFRIETS